MVLRLALHGPIYSGKTSLAYCLAARAGFTLVDYTGYLKVLAARSLTAVDHLVSAGEISDRKADYRPYLQALGTVLDFDSGAYVEEVLREQAAVTRWSFTPPLPHQGLASQVVFDNVRTLAQLEVLRAFRFVLVRLTLSREEQTRRAAALGVSREELDTVSGHGIETPIPVQPDEIVLNGDYDTTTVVGNLYRELAHRESVAS